MRPSSLGNFVQERQRHCIIINKGAEWAKHHVYLQKVKETECCEDRTQIISGLYHNSGSFKRLLQADL